MTASSRSNFAAVTAGFVLGSTATTVALLYLHKHYTQALLAEHSSKPSSSPSASSLAIHDRVNFLSDLVKALWRNLDPALSATIIEMIEPSFKDMLPGPLSRLRFTSLRLGSKPMRLDNITVHEKNGIVQFDMDMTWHAECDIQLKADYLGKFGIKQIHVQGRLTFLLTPSDVLPAVSAVQYAFANKPYIGLDFTGLAQVADLTVLKASLLEIVHQSLSSMMVLPQRMVYKIDPTKSFIDIHTPPKNVARVTLVRGRGFEVEEKLIGKNDIPDVYVNLTLGDRDYRSSVVDDSCEPVWNESFDFLLADEDQVLSLHAWDRDSGALDADDDLGSAKVSIGDLLLAGKRKTVPLLVHGRERGAELDLLVEIVPLCENLDCLSTTKANSIVGMLDIIVTQAFDLDVTKTNAYVKVRYDKHTLYTSAVVDAPGIDTVNPVFDAAFCIQLAPTGNIQSDVTLELWNGTKLLGSTSVEFEELEAADHRRILDRRSVAGKTKLEFCVTLRGVSRESTTSTPTPSLAAAAHTSTEPAKSDGLGKVRLTAVSGRGFRIQKGFLRRDIPDVYCQIQFGSSPSVWRTPTVRNHTKPVWNDSSEYPLQHHQQIVSVEVYDEDKRGQDDYLGGARVSIGSLLLAGGEKEVELQRDGQPSSTYVTLSAEILDEK